MPNLGLGSQEVELRVTLLELAVVSPCVKGTAISPKEGSVFGASLRCCAGSRTLCPLTRARRRQRVAQGNTAWTG
jgi:hypothetical protein